MSYRPLAVLPLLLGLAAPLSLHPGQSAAEGLTLVQEAQPSGKAAVAALSEALMMDDVFEVMVTEGLAYGGTLEEEMFPGAGGADWVRVVTAIYDLAAMRARFDERLAKELEGEAAATAAAQAFFGSAQGQRILKLEIEARRALADEAAKEAAEVAVEDMIAEQDPRMEALREFAEANELVEMNVTAALNANLAFYQGLAVGGAFGGEMTEEQMLSDVWSQEADVRAETETWLFSYLALAYAPLSDEDLEAYQAFSETPDGKRVNHALFAAFDAVFAPISRDLGVAAARQMQGEDI